MKKNEVMNKISGSLRMAGYKIQKHSPEILMAVGIVGTVASVVVACKATLKVDEVMDETKDKLDTIHEAKEKGATAAGKDYSEDDAKKDTVIVYTQTAMKFVKLYAPAITLGVISITSILASNNILRKRNVAIASAYAAIDKSFKDYREKVVDRFGEDVDKELRYHLKAETYTETETDEETGEKKKVKKTRHFVNGDEFGKFSDYAAIFGKYTEDEEGHKVLNPHWESNMDYNLMYLKAQERYANDLLVSKKRLFLNEVREMLGLPATKAGQIVGWVYDPDNPKIDNYVDFGLYSGHLFYENYENEKYNSPAILVDFNVDGNIWDLM